MSAFWILGKEFPLYSKPSLFHEEYVLHSSGKEEGVFIQLKDVNPTGARGNGHVSPVGGLTPAAMC